jgi:hypothetical protein
MVTESEVSSTFYPCAQLEFLRGRFVTEDLDPLGIGWKTSYLQPRLDVGNG